MIRHNLINNLVILFVLCSEHREQYNNGNQVNFIYFQIFTVGRFCGKICKILYILALLTYFINS